MPPKTPSVTTPNSLFLYSEESNNLLFFYQKTIDSIFIIW